MGLQKIVSLCIVHVCRLSCAFSMKFTHLKTIYSMNHYLYYGEQIGMNTAAVLPGAIAQGLPKEIFPI